MMQYLAERRENRRIPVAFDAVLSYRQHTLVCTLRDISMDGAFLNTYPDELPYTDAHVELGLTFNKNGNYKHCRIPARIRRISEDGAAISFSDVGIDAYSNLVSIVYQS